MDTKKGFISIAAVVIVFVVVGGGTYYSVVKNIQTLNTDYVENQDHVSKTFKKVFPVEFEILQETEEATSSNDESLREEKDEGGGSNESAVVLEIKEETIEKTDKENTYI